MTGVPGHHLNTQLQPTPSPSLASPRTGRMASNSSPDYEALKALVQQEREARKQAEGRLEQAEARLGKTTFVEFLRYCHDVLSPRYESGPILARQKGRYPFPKGSTVRRD